MNSHDVIYVDFSRMPENCASFATYIERVSKGIKEDLIQEYPELELDADKTVWDKRMFVMIWQ